MAGIITISKGHDASYPWKQIGTAEVGRDAKGGVGYYLSPAERGGEPPGIWTGKGVAELGLVPGGEVDRAVFEPLYGHTETRVTHLRRPCWGGHPGGSARRRRFTRRCWPLSRRRPPSAALSY